METQRKKETSALIKQPPFYPSMREVREGFYYGVAEGLRQAALEAQRRSFFGHDPVNDRFAQKFAEWADTRANELLSSAPETTKAHSEF